MYYVELIVVSFFTILQSLPTFQLFLSYSINLKTHSTVICDSFIYLEYTKLELLEDSYCPQYVHKNCFNTAHTTTYNNTAQ